ncbi:MAG: ROK family protein [Niameybacter sp.]|uniref:ROK family protein n=1 Tax=Niameybacter sp. TaxID=2033640 RepID=UPI002FCA093C
MNGFIALDVGGTSIKSGIISDSGQLLSPKISHSPSHSLEDLGTLLNHFTSIIIDELKNVSSSITIQGIGMAFPGPFDYKNGISLMQNINKYDALYGIDLHHVLKVKLDSCEAFKAQAAPHYSIRFENDASLYALGETVQDESLMTGKVLCLCIGTGLGSAFLEDGKLITSRQDVPPNGWVYDTPFLGSIIDNHISARGILKLHEQLHGISMPDVKSIADLALQGDLYALTTFKYFGKHFGEAISSFLKTFEPHTLVIGGQIAKSYTLFESGLQASLATCPPSVHIELSPDSSLSTLIGVKQLFLD